MQTTLTSLLLALGSVQAASVPRTRGYNSSRPTFFNGTCDASSLTIRKEWRNMLESEKKAYLQAEKCLFSLPAKTDGNGVTNRWSDMQASHREAQNVTVAGAVVGDIIHNVGQFLPWHRYFMHTHETLLRTECNYTGPMTWWDEERDANAGNLFQSNMWDADAFGGNGTGTGLCVVDGAFANTTMNLGPGWANEPYCLDRDWTSEYLEWMTTENVERCTSHNDYYTFMNCMVDFLTSPHVAGHNTTGGMMADIYASAGDPMFMMHHNYIDRMWWKWQTANASSRLFDMSGNAFNNSYLEEHGVVLPADVNMNTTLDYVVTVSDIMPDIKVEKVMNAQGGLLCYDYDY